METDDLDQSDDAQAHIEDLALNSDFDPALFDYGWNEENPSLKASTSTIGGSQTCNSLDGRRDANGGSDRGSSSPVQNGNGGGGQVSFGGASTEESITSFLLENGETTNSSLQEQPMNQAAVTGVRNTKNATLPAVSIASSSFTPQVSQTNNGNTQGPAATSVIPQQQQQEQQLHHLAINSSATCPPNMAAAFSAQVAAAAAVQAQQVASQQQQAFRTDPNAAMLLFPMGLNGFPPLGANSLQHPVSAYFLQQQQQQAQQQLQQALQQQHALVTKNTEAAALSAGTTPEIKAPTTRKRKASGKAAAAKSNTKKGTYGGLPPFLLFDAPIELRANFIASQRAHGIVPTEDNNSFHYGMAVNGFHPSQHQPQNGAAGGMGVATNGGGGSNNGAVRLIDGRHGDVGNKRMKNAREQKRTQKITDLIDQLRDKMERGGWKIGHKSKFHTLSSCAEYVKHLVKGNKEKEDALEKTRNELVAKRRRIEEERQDQSDPESTTSSLTNSSKSENKDCAAPRTLPKQRADSPSGRNSPNNNASTAAESSSANSSGGDDDRKQPSFDQSHSISDLTDSNKESSNEGSTAAGCRSSRRRAKLEDGEKSSNDHVAPLKQKDGRSDFVVQGRTRNLSSTVKTETLELLERSFELDYEEVFLKSNVPQVLATTSGRIVAWNEFFLKATGLTTSEIQKLTVFSLVKSNRLSTMFEIVAAALRSGSPQDDAASSDDGEPELQPDDSESGFKAITLPCTSFRRPLPRIDEPIIESFDKEMYITATLLTDSDPQKRCFHCIFTDSPGTNGTLGVVTPELLSMLFTAPVDSKDSDAAPIDKETESNTPNVGSG